MKLVFLAVERIEKQWTVAQAHWGLFAQQLRIHFSERMPLTL